MERQNGKIQNRIWTLLLAAYPFVGVNQGLSVADTTYSLSNFAFFPEMKGTWAVATYLANALGYALMQLPFGDTMLGMNFYTRIVTVLMAVVSYYVLKKVFPMWLTAVAEMIAVGLCWAPSTTLYHYLTYLFIQMASLCLFKAFTVPAKDQKKWFLMAGVTLGINVGVRMPNVTHAALILAVWYGTYLTCEDKKGIWTGLWKNTWWCVCGYLPGLLLPLLAVCRRFGTDAYPDMIRTLFAMTEKAQDYKPGSMVAGIVGGYFEGLPWFALMALCVVCGSALAAVLNRFVLKTGQSRTEGVKYLFMASYTAALLVLFRFFWGRGMFDFRYYNYGSVYNLTVLFLWIALMVHGYILVRPGLPEKWKILAAVSLLQVFLVPLGGNNGLYPVMNQMFLVCPVTMGLLYRLLTTEGVPLFSVRSDRPGIPFCVKTAAFLTAAVLFVQSVGFHACFALQDGIWGDKRNAQAASAERLAGIYTTEQNAQTIEELSAFVSDRGLTGKKVILYGEIPGLGYILHMPSALTTFWPDLDSYRAAECERDLKDAEGRISMMGMEPPVIIVSAGIAAWLGDDAKALCWLDVDTDAMQADEKLCMIRRFLNSHAYEQTFSSASYAVYQSCP